MPRAPRIQIPDVVYHVTSRGVDRQPIFDVVEQDRQVFLMYLAKTVGRYGWLCHAYCLMGNHFHLAVETPLANISAGMQFLKGKYARFVNDLKPRLGTLFERRFDAVICEDERHAYEVTRYIVLNPVRAGLRPRPELWPWSSYRAAVGLVPKPAYVSLDRQAQLFGDGDTGMRRFRSFVEEALSNGAGSGVRPGTRPDLPTPPARRSRGTSAPRPLP
jgi:REP element-mobilizing transposase RayT